MHEDPRHAAGDGCLRERAVHTERNGEGKPEESWSAQFSEARLRVETILLVEDEKFVREVTSEVLRSAGYRVLAAKSAAEAVAAYEGNPDGIDLLLTDLILPGLNGRDLAARLRSEDPAIKVLFVTGYADQMKIEAANLERLLAKPFSSGILLRAVGDFLAERCEHCSGYVTRVCDSGSPA